MKRTAAVLLVAALVVSLTGCGGGGETSDAADTFALLVDSTQAMTDVGSYRMSGSIEMDSGTGTGAESQTISMDIRADVQNGTDGMRQHMFVILGDYEVEAYIVGGVYYQNLPGQGWMKMSTSAYMSQNMSLGIVDAEQMQMMAELAKDAQVIEENDETIGISFQLNQEYMQASLDLYRKQIEEGDEPVSEEWLQMAEEAMSDFRAEINIWLSKADNLMQRMEMTYSMGGQSEMGEITSSIQMDFFDYGQDIVIELPPEAAQAQEFSIEP